MTRVKTFPLFHMALIQGERYCVKIVKEIADAAERHDIQVVIHHDDDCCREVPWLETREKLNWLMREASEGTIAEFPEDEDD